jgi:hypothetical protein
MSDNIKWGFKDALPKKSGDGLPGLEVNSGWNCAPMKNL